MPVNLNSNSTDAERLQATTRQDDFESERQSCGLRLFPSPDPLTKLLMIADGVVESDLRALLKQIGTGRTAR
jgi:hypothetical protein